MLFFLLFGRSLGPRPNSKKKNTPPTKQQKKQPKSPNNKKDQTTKKINTLTDLMVWLFDMQPGCFCLSVLFMKGAVPDNLRAFHKCR